MTVTVLFERSAQPLLESLTVTLSEPTGIVSVTFVVAPEVAVAEPVTSAAPFRVSRL